MVGKLFIDGLDAFSEYGIFVEQYGYKALVQMPSFKKLSSTEWPEYDGEEVDLSAPQMCIRDRPYTDGRMVPDRKRIGELQELILSFVETAGGTEYWLSTCLLYTSRCV